MIQSRFDGAILVEDLIETIHEAVIITNDKAEVVYANSSIFTQFRITTEKIIGRSLLNHSIGLGDASRFRLLFDEILPHQDSFQDFEIRHRSQELGERIWLLNGRRLSRERGEPLLFMLSFRDITEFSVIRRELEESEERFRRFVEGINSIIIRLDREGNITFFNAFAERLFGYAREEVFGKPFIGTIVPCVETSGKSNADICEQMFTVPDKHNANENEGMRKDGSRLWFSWSAKVIRDGSGTVNEIFIDGNDITQVRNQHLQLERETNLFRTLMEFIPLGVMITDEKHVVQSVSKSIEEILGVPRERLVGTDEKGRLKLIDLRHSDGKKIHPNELPLSLATLNDRQYKNFETMLYLNGVERNLSTNATPIKDETGRVVGAIGVWQDFTDQISAMREAERNRSELKSQREFFENVLSNARVAIAVFRGQDLRVAYANPAYQAIRSDTPMQGRFYRDIFPEAAKLGAEQKMLDVLRSGKPWIVQKYSAPIPGKPDAAWEGQVVRLEATVEDQEPSLLAIVWDVTENVRAERALQISAERFKRITSSIIVGCVIGNPDGTFSMVNDYFLDIVGYTRDEFEAGGINWRQITPPEYLPLDLKALEDLQKTGAAPPYEKQYIRKDGSRAWVLIADTVLPGPEQQIFAFVLDITERKAAEETLQRSEEKVTLAIENFSEGAIIATESEQIIYWNRAAREMHGMTDEREGIKPLESTAITFELWTSDGSHMLEVDEWPMRRIKRGETVRNLELRLRRLDQGWEKTVSYSGTMLETTAGERLLFLSVYDLTELRLTEQTLRRTRDTLQAVLDAAPAGILVCDETGQITLSSSAVRRILGGALTGDAHGPSGEYVVRTVDGAPVARGDVPMSKALRGTEVSNEELLIVRPGGFRTSILVSAVPLRSGTGTIQGAIAVFQSIDERKRMEAEIQQHLEELGSVNRELESFSYSVAHDLRNPLRAIRGFVELLTEECRDRLDDECREYLARIGDGTTRMNSIIDDMLALSRISRQEIVVEEVNLSEMARSAVSELQASQPDRRVSVTIQNDVVVRADARLMSVALGNLLGNAWKYTSKTENPQIDFGFYHEENTMVFFVRDNGSGFDMRYAAELFKPFKRLHSDTEFKGTGVGLAIVERAISRHGGKVWAKAEMGRGATFYFTLNPKPSMVG